MWDSYRPKYPFTVACHLFLPWIWRYTFMIITPYLQNIRYSCGSCKMHALVALVGHTMLLLQNICDWKCYNTSYHTYDNPFLFSVYIYVYIVYIYIYACKYVYKAMYSHVYLYLSLSIYIYISIHIYMSTLIHFLLFLFFLGVGVRRIPGPNCSCK